MTQKSGKLKGKKAEPLTAELEFIYRLIGKGATDEEILEEMQDEEFLPLRKAGSIKRRRREYNAAKKVFEEKGELGVQAAEGLPSVATQLKTQLYFPPPEAVLIDDFGGHGHHSFYFRQDVFRVICQNLGYSVSQFKVIKERSGMPSGDIEINVAVLDYGDVELYYPVEEHPSFQDMFSSLPEKAREQLSTLKLDGGKYLVKCKHIRSEIHKEAEENTWQSPYEAVTRVVPQLQGLPPPLTPNFANLVYRLCILYHRTSGEYGLPNESRYHIRRDPGYHPPLFSGLYLGEILLANGLDPPHVLEGCIGTHRDMIKKWSALPAIIELLELFESLHAIEEEIKQQLDQLVYST